METNSATFERKDGKTLKLASIKIERITPPVFGRGNPFINSITQYPGLKPGEFYNPFILVSKSIYLSKSEY